MAETLLFDHVHLAVPDPSEAQRWYGAHVGGEWVDGEEDALIFGTTRVVFGPGADRRPSGGSAVDHVGFSFTDLDAKLEELEAAGATLVVPPRSAEGLFRFAFVDDPWGARIELIEDRLHLGFHHIHLNASDPDAAYRWYHERFGGVRMRLRGRIDALLYPGNAWILVREGETRPSTETAVDHIGFRTRDTSAKVVELEAKGTVLDAGPADVSRPQGSLHRRYVRGPHGLRIEVIQRPLGTR